MANASIALKSIPSILRLAISVLAVLLVSQSAAFSQALSLPDWSGVWERFEGNGGIFDPATVEPKDGRAGSPGVRQYPPLTDTWEAKYRVNLALAAKDRLPDPISFCGTPAGFPRLLALPDVYEFIVRPEASWIITENGPNIMRIYTDGRKHAPPDELWPTFTGDSVGHWEGQTLVFTTVSLIGEKHTVLDRSGLTLSDQAKVATRMFITDEGLLRAELTIEDPLALREPWHVIRHFRMLPDGTRVYDYACAENNRNPITDFGQTLTLDAEGNTIDIIIDDGRDN